jgi:VanZ family protein
MAAIFALSATPDLSTGLGVWDLVGRKIGHAASYGALAWLWFWTLRGAVGRPMAAAAAISILYAVTDEYHQTFIEGRHGTPLDVLIDSVGVAIAAALARRQGSARASRSRSP